MLIRIRTKKISNENNDKFFYCLLSRMSRAFLTDTKKLLPSRACLFHFILSKKNVCIIRGATTLEVAYQLIIIAQRNLKSLANRLKNSKEIKKNPQSALYLLIHPSSSDIALCLVSHMSAYSVRHLDRLAPCVSLIFFSRWPTLFGHTPLPLAYV